jgi:TonB family protein
MFGGVVETGEHGSKKGLYIGGGIAAAVIVIAVVAFSLMGGKKTTGSNAPAPTAPAAPAANAPAENAAPANATPPAQTPAAAPKEKQPPAEKAGPSPAEIEAARRDARSRLNAFDKAVGDLAQGGADKYAGDTLASLKESQRSLASLLRRAKTPNDYKSVSDGAQKGLSLADQAKTQIEKAKADEAAAAAKKAQEDAAAKKAADAAAKKAKQDEALKKAQTAAAKKTKPGDFVALWAVDVRPREIKKVNVKYTVLARRYKVEGTVFVEVNIDETGKVTTAKIVKGLSPDYGLNEACLKAALQGKYTPAIKDGVPVKTTLTYPVVFKIK